ncbi:hypothetical protein GUK36_15505 [Rhizobium leguminosarum]|uniref:Uncharacterized protein n=1 Tax=Rhizobium leguminosarum TaxID=384 RepID=A0A6P0DG96_RHILE|nr:hypothetical protein [Rhizobium leguminosarum]NEK50835.1 hypothetical protein [Rhizobium leguminosarum]
MQSELKRMEALRYEANQILAEGVTKRYPLLLSVLAVRLMFRKDGVPAPDDVLAFASAGKINMSVVDDWESPWGC